MAIYQFWRKLLDGNGRPVNGAKVTVYLSGTTTKANIYNGNNVSITNPVTTNSSGVFVFYVRNYAEISGYAGTQRFKLSWTGTDEDGNSVSGEIDRVHIFPNLFQVDETDNTGSDKSAYNKLASNELAYQWDDHIIQTWENEVHGFKPINTNDPNDATKNKLVSNYVMNELDSLLASAQTPFISSSGAVAITISVGLSSSADPVKWTPSGSVLYADIDHNLNIQHPIVTIYESSGGVFYPWRIESIDKVSPYNTVRIFSTLNIEAEVTAVG